MVIVRCSVPSCDFETQDVSEALAIAMSQNHGLAHQATIASPEPTPNVRPPSFERPRIDVGVSTEDWNVFVRRWNVFRTGSGINEVTAAAQLFQCAGPQFGDHILKTNTNATTDHPEQLLETMRSLAVIPVATSVSRTELLQLRQERDEPFRSFAARVRGKAETCEFSSKCECGKNVDYTPHMSRDVLLNGTADPDIRREILGTKNITQSPVNEVISLVESKEKARNALPSSRVSAVSSFRHQQNPRPDTTTMKPPPPPSPLTNLKRRHAQTATNGSRFLLRVSEAGIPSPTKSASHAIGPAVATSVHVEHPTARRLQSMRTKTPIRFPS